MSTTGFVLVHGGGHDSRCWAPLVPCLDGPVLVVDLPGRGSNPSQLEALTINDFVESVVADLDNFEAADQVVLVGHSMAGVTIPGVAARRQERIAHLVFLSCFVPKDGSSIALEMPRPLRLITRILSRRPVQTPMNPRLAKYIFCNDMDASQTALTLSILVPEARSIFTEIVSRKDLPPAELVPRTYIKTLRDHSLRPRFQDRLVDNLGDSEVIGIDAGHDVMISRPLQLAAILNGIAAK